MSSKFLGAVAAIALLAGSSAAAAQSAQSLSLANAPVAAGAQTTDASELGSRGYGIYIIGAIVIGLIIWGAIELLDDDPESP